MTTVSTIRLVVNQVEREQEIRESNGQRVVTFKDIDLLHGRVQGTARKRFNDNKKHFIEGTDYFVRNSDEARSEFGITAPNGLVLLTESGYLLLAKSFTDDLSWDVQRELVNGYFRAKVQSNVSVLSKDQALATVLRTTADLVENQHEMRVLIEAQADKLAQVERKVNEEITLDSGEQRALQRAVARRVYEIESDVTCRRELFKQLHREIKDRWGVASYRDVRRVELQEVLLYVQAWKPRMQLVG